jgi:hypothetical protein
VPQGRKLNRSLRPRARALAVLAACALISGSGLTTNDAASADPDTTISGAVTDSSGSPLAGIQVTAFGNVSFGEALTGADGTYTISDFTTETAFVQFVDPSNRYTPEWWDDKTNAVDATPIEVTSGVSTTGIDAELSLTTISGVVTDDVTGEPLGGIDVVASGDADADLATTAADGTYTIFGLVPGEYTLQFSDPRACTARNIGTIRCRPARRSP